MTGPQPELFEPFLHPGTRVSHYEIRDSLGQGGMGIVYRALDLSLLREVAIKCIRPDRVADPDLTRRMVREARAASRLAHPNIVRILDVLEVDSLPAIVMELIEGESLRDRIDRRGPLPVEEVLAHGEALARALEAAHGEHVLHRDVTPNNVLIATDGRAVLMDFGLARCTARPDSGTAESTQSALSALVGTPGYLSPDQLLGREVDQRTDIFSLGAVLYEMCTGTRAFTGSSTGELIDATLNREPTAIARLNYLVPEELERIIRKALAKRPDERYQTAGELVADLKALRRRNSESTGRIAAPVLRRHRLWPLAGGIVIGATAVVTVGWLLLGERRGPSPLPTAASRQLTGGQAHDVEPAVSPDGSFVAYASDQTGNLEIYLADVVTGQTLRLTDDPAEDRAPTWFPDGSTIAFCSNRSGGGGVWKVTRLGGAPLMLLPEAIDPAISPDGTQIAFARAAKTGGGVRIWVANLREPARARVLTGDGDGLLNHRRPAWSRDGRKIYYEDFNAVWVVPAQAGAAVRLSPPDATELHPEPSPDGRTVYVERRDGEHFAIWRTPLHGGKTQGVTLGTGNEGESSLSHDGRLLAYSTRETDYQLVLLDLASGARTALPGPRLAYWSTIPGDESRVFALASAGGGDDIWEIPLRAGRPNGEARRVTALGDVGTAAVSPDGRWLAFHRDISGQRDVWLCPSEGGVPARVTDSPGVDANPAWSPDGRRLAFISDRGGSLDLWVVGVQGGQVLGDPARLTELPGNELHPTWSPRGDAVAFVVNEPGSSEAYVVDAEGKHRPRKVTTGADAAFVVYARDPAYLLLSGRWHGASLEVRRVRIEDGASESLDPPLVLGGEAALGSFAVSPKGGLLACLQQRTRGGIWVLEAREGCF